MTGGKSSNLPEIRNATSKVGDHDTGPIAVLLQVPVADACINLPHGWRLSNVELSIVTSPADNDRLSQLLRSLGVFLCLALCCFLSMVLFF